MMRDNPIFSLPLSLPIDTSNEFPAFHRNLHRSHPTVLLHSHSHIHVLMTYSPVPCFVCLSVRNSSRCLPCYVPLSLSSSLISFPYPILFIPNVHQQPADVSLIIYSNAITNPFPLSYHPTLLIRNSIAFSESRVKLRFGTLTCPILDVRSKFECNVCLTDWL